MKEKILKIINIIKMFFIDVFNISNIKKLESAKENIITEEDIALKLNKEKQLEKERIIDLYYKIKRDEVGLEELNTADLEKVKILMEEEIELQKDRLERKKTEKVILEREIHQLVKCLNS